MEPHRSTVMSRLGVRLAGIGFDVKFLLAVAGGLLALGLLMGLDLPGR